MEDTKAKILAYMHECYEKTRWPFFPLNDLAYKFGKDTRAACNSLYKDGIVNAHAGINSKLCELIL